MVQQSFKVDAMFGAVVRRNDCQLDHKIFPNTPIPCRSRPVVIAVGGATT